MRKYIKYNKHVPNVLMIGRSFNKWTVLEEIFKFKQQSKHYICKCECGTISILNAQSLKEARSKQCHICAFKKHGMTHTVTYKIWTGIKSRCYNPKVRIYKYYGGRGITMCDRWKNSFDNFLEDMGERPLGLQLDRIDNNKGYSPENCRWVTPKENNPVNKGDYIDNMPGKRFGKWFVEEEIKHKPGHRYYTCICDCGTKKIIAGGELRQGRTKQCLHV
jgi:hypothetical protein